MGANTNGVTGKLKLVSSRVFVLSRVFIVAVLTMLPFFISCLLERETLTGLNVFAVVTFGTASCLLACI